KPNGQGKQRPGLQSQPQSAHPHKQHASPSQPSQPSRNGHHQPKRNGPQHQQPRNGHHQPKRNGHQHQQHRSPAPNGNDGSIASVGFMRPTQRHKHPSNGLAARRSSR